MQKRQTRVFFRGFSSLFSALFSSRYKMYVHIHSRVKWKVYYWTLHVYVGRKKKKAGKICTYSWKDIITEENAASLFLVFSLALERKKIYICIFFLTIYCIYVYVTISCYIKFIKDLKSILFIFQLQRFAWKKRRSFRARLLKLFRYFTSCNIYIQYK